MIVTYRKADALLFLLILLCIILFFPLISTRIESQLELFLFFCSLLAIIGTNQFSLLLIKKAILSPLSITGAVFIASLLFFFFEKSIQHTITKSYHYLPKRLFLAAIPMILGVLSSIITAIIASLLLATIANTLSLKRKDQIRFVIINCFAIGVGAALTPIGEPLSTIVTNQLNESTSFLFELLAPIILPMLMLFSLVTALIIKPSKYPISITTNSSSESIASIFIRTSKIYVFVFALTLLGVSFQPFISQYVLPLSTSTIYWMNMLSAILDNATLAAAEISPLLPEETIRTMLISLLISGGMLIPGNIPNIIVAKQLSITSKEWVKFGVPFGMTFMLIYYFFLLHF